MLDGPPVLKARRWRHDEQSTRFRPDAQDFGGQTCRYRLVRGAFSRVPVPASTVTLTGGTIPAGGSCVVTATVSGAVAGSYFNSIAAGALATSNGSNAAPAIATLTIITPVAAPVPPTVGKAFSPAAVDTR
jgi:hypothetical protein